MCEALLQSVAMFLFDLFDSRYGYCIRYGRMRDVFQEPSTGMNGSRTVTRVPLFILSHFPRSGKKHVSD